MPAELYCRAMQENNKRFYHVIIVNGGLPMNFSISYPCHHARIIISSPTHFQTDFSILYFSSKLSSTFKLTYKPCVAILLFFFSLLLHFSSFPVSITCSQTWRATSHGGINLSGDTSPTDCQFDGNIKFKIPFIRHNKIIA